MIFNKSLQFGMNFGRMIANIFSTQNSGFVIAHRINGRRRYICQTLIHSRDLCFELENLLKQVPGVISVKASHITGSVVIVYNTNESEIDMLFDSLSHTIAGQHAQQEASLLPSAVITVSDNINVGLTVAKEQVKNFFNHTEPLFISRVVGMGLLVYGIIRMIYRGDRPAGPQLFWWGLGLLLRQSHKHNQAIGQKNNE